MEKSAVSNFLYVIVAVEFYLFWEFVYKNTRRPCNVSEKAYNCPVREF